MRTRGPPDELELDTEPPLPLEELDDADPDDEAVPGRPVKAPPPKPDDPPKFAPAPPEDELAPAADPPAPDTGSPGEPEDVAAPEELPEGSGGEPPGVHAPNSELVVCPPQDAATARPIPITSSRRSALTTNLLPPAGASHNRVANSYITSSVTRPGSLMGAPFASIVHPAASIVIP